MHFKHYKYNYTFKVVVNSSNSFFFQDRVQLVGDALPPHYDRDRADGHRGGAEAAAATDSPRTRIRNVGRSQRAAAKNARLNIFELSECRKTVI